jgi:hypothetical protein
VSGTLDDLCSHARTRRAKWDTVPWASITVRLGDVAAGPPRYTGVVLIDRRQLGYLIGGEPRAFRVDPGEHTITVYLGRRPGSFDTR